MNMAISLLTTLKGSLLEGYFPKGWDLETLDAICARAPEAITERERWWNKAFEPISCSSLADFDVMLGHEIAREIAHAAQTEREVAFILPVGPMGMYRWAVYFLREWKVSCKHVHGFNMDE